MKKILSLLLVMVLIGVPPALSVTLNDGTWRNSTAKQTPAGTDLVNDIDVIIDGNIVQPLETLLNDYREGLKLTYNSGSTVDVTAGQIAVENSGGSIRLMLETTSTTSVTFSDLDTGSEASSTTYYVYAIAATATTTTATFKISASSTAPDAAFVYFKRLGSFVNNGSSDMTQIINDDVNFIIATGTVSNGGTISLPSGYSQDECDWTVSLNSLTGVQDQHATKSYDIDVSVSSSRVATVTETGGSGLTAATGTANYAIWCFR